MSELIVVPHRGLEAAKTRLAPILSPDERVALSRRLLQRVLGAIGGRGDRCRALVISPDPALAEVVEPAGARLLVQRGMGLNAGLEQARALALSEGVELLAVLHGDLPNLESDDISALVGAVQLPAGVAIAPDRRWSGTNGLAMRPADAVAFRFGPGSFEAHQQAATAAGLPVTVVERPGLAFDLDTPADLERLLHQEASG